MTSSDQTEVPIMRVHDAADMGNLRLWWRTTAETSRHSQALYRRITIAGLSDLFLGLLMTLTGIIKVVVTPILAIVSFLITNPIVCIRRTIEIRRFLEQNPEIVEASRKSEDQPESTEEPN